MRLGGTHAGRRERLGVGIPFGQSVGNQVGPRLRVGHARQLTRKAAAGGAYLPLAGPRGMATDGSASRASKVSSRSPRTPATGDGGTVSASAQPAPR